MTSAAKIAANRRNAQRSTGPRSAAGKARTRYNTLQHRLNVPARYDQATADEIEGLAAYLSAESTMRAAEAQFDLLRVQRAIAAGASRVCTVNSMALPSRQITR